MTPTDRDMLKLIEAMDAFVRMIVIFVFVMGSLQLAGFARNGKIVQAMPQYSMVMRRGDGLAPLSEERRMIFNKTDVSLNIPVSLMNLNELMQSARPAMQRLRELARRRYEQADVTTVKFNRIRRKHHEGPIIQMDGSSSRVLLRI
ncbi:hypothetical protein CBL_01922 [Carabus blaptoides fortunei]